MTEDKKGSSGIDQLRVLIQESQEDYHQVQSELKEIDVLIRQGTTEVEKLAQRNTQLVSRVRQMEMNLETYPRSDIKEIYDAAHEAHLRLFMMRGQLEQHQYRQQSLQQQSERLHRIIEAASHISPSDFSGKGGLAGAGAPSDLVRVIETQENERLRLSRQIHDGPAQSLTNLILQAEICELLFDSDPVQARAELANLKTTTAATFKEIREFILTLRPMMLDDLGLVPTLKQYVQDFEEGTGLSVHYTIFGREARLPPYTEVAVFRGVQELLTNIEQHAHASHAQVSLDFQDTMLIVSVEDDGSGFDAKAVHIPGQGRQGLGLSTTRERIELLGGNIQIESRIGQGTKVRMTIPHSVQ